MFKVEVEKASSRDRARESGKTTWKIVFKHSGLAHAEFYISCIVTL